MTAAASARRSRRQAGRATLPGSKDAENGSRAVDAPRRRPRGGTVGGEVDLETASQLGDHALDALRDVCPHLVLDLAAVTFMDSTGLKVLLSIQRRADLADGSFAIAGAARPVRKILSLTGLDQTFTLYDSLDDVPPSAERSAAPQGPRPEQVDPGLQLLGGGLRGRGPPQARRSSACTAPCGLPVRWCQAPTSPLSSLRSAGDRPVRRRLGLRRGGPAGSGRWPLSWSAWRCSSVGDLVGLQQPGQAEEVLLLLASRARPRVPNSPPSKSTRSNVACGLQRLERPAPRRRRLVLRRLASASSASSGVDRCPRRRPSGRSSAWSRSTSISPARCSRAGTVGRKTDAVSPRRRARTNRPDGLGEEQRRRGRGGVDADGQARHVDALGDHPDRDHPAVVAGGELLDPSLAPASSDSTTVGALAGDPRAAARRRRAPTSWSVAMTRPPASGTPRRTSVSRLSAAASTWRDPVAPAGRARSARPAPVRSLVSGSPRRAVISSPALVRQRISPA